MADLHGWQSDPFNLHEQRYFSQGQPTKLVRDGGVESYDAPPDAPSVQESSFPGNAPQAPGPGWWLASDGNWYPPETHPDGAPAGPGWWLASDGNWYPPETHPDAAPSEVIAGS